MSKEVYELVLSNSDKIQNFIRLESTEPVNKIKTTYDFKIVNPKFSHRKTFKHDTKRHPMGLFIKVLEFLNHSPVFREEVLPTWMKD